MKTERNEKAEQAELSQIKLLMGVRADINTILDMIYDETGEIADRTEIEKAVTSNVFSCVVSKLNNKMIGFMIYRASPTKSVVVDRILVRNEYKRQEIGRSMIRVLTNNVNYREIETIVNENNLTAQLFFRACGFKCKNQIKDWFNNTESGYVFRYTKP